jgi:hypothetical protein
MNPFGRSQEIPGAFARPMGVEKAVQADAMQSKINLRMVFGPGVRGAATGQILTRKFDQRALALADTSWLQKIQTKHHHHHQQQKFPR